MTKLLVVLGVLVGLALGAPAGADELAATARQVIEKKGDAIITIEVVTEQKWAYGGQQSESEEKSEALGTVVSADGIVVTSLSNVDHSQLLQRLRAEDDDSSFSITVKEVKFILADDSEVPAMVALRDVDLDIAVLVPKEKLEKPMTALALGMDAKPEILDRVFTIARMGKIAKRTIVAMSGEIQGIVSRPRTYYITSAEITSGGTGVPVFGDDGELVGIVTLHVLAGAMAPGAGNDEPVIPVVLPISDITGIVNQLPERETAK